MSQERSQFMSNVRDIFVLVSFILAIVGFGLLATRWLCILLEELSRMVMSTRWI